MRILLLLVALWFSSNNLFAQDDQKQYNRYGMVLVESPQGWVVHGQQDMAKKFKFNPDTVALWNEPWTYVPNKIQQSDLSKCTVESLEYKQYSYHVCHMDVYLPKGQGKGPFPFMMFIHGGGWTTGHEKTPNMVLPASWFASNGIAVMSVSYTLSGQGTFEQTKADLNDALSFITKNASKWGVDADRFGFYGFSAGGHLCSYMAMTTPGTKLFISLAGPADMTQHGNGWLDKRLDLSRYFAISTDNQDNLRKVSPMYLIPHSASEIPAAMIIQGSMDMLVDARPIVDFVAKLKANGASVVELRLVPYGPHGVVNPHFYRYEEFMFEMLNFAKKYLKP